MKSKEDEIEELLKMEKEHLEMAKEHLEIAKLHREVAAALREEINEHTRNTNR